jgi:hypothetical protein
MSNGARSFAKVHCSSVSNMGFVSQLSRELERV